MQAGVRGLWSVARGLQDEEDVTISDLMRVDGVMVRTSMQMCFQKLDLF